MTETALIGGCILAVAYFGLSLFGGDLSRLFESMVTPPAESMPAISGINSATVATVAPIHPTLPANSVRNPDGSITLTLSNGTIVTIPGTGQLGLTAEATGANGSTDLMLAQMDALVNALKENETSLDSSQLNALAALSNQGHDIAGREAALEAYIKASTGVLSDGPIVYNGITYPSAAAFAKTIDTASSGTKGESTAAFAKLYQQALDSGAMDDPSVSAIVSQLAGNIDVMANGFAESAYWGIQDNWTGDRASSNFVSKMTNADARGICSTGAGIDTGMYCH